MTKITIGSTIIGNSGKKLIVDRIDGDILYSGKLKIKTSAVVKVIPPSTAQNLEYFLKVGDRVYIPACNKYGEIVDISAREGKSGLFAHIHRDDGIERHILLDCLEVVA